MKKSTLAASIALAVCAFSAQADKQEPQKAWFGAYGLYYEASDLPEGLDLLEDGTGIGLEAGFRFAPQWGVRFEYGAFQLNSNDPTISPDEAGALYGTDIMYFLPNEAAYLFSGVKILNLEQDYTRANVGIGKHWSLEHGWKLVTEAATYFGEGDNDIGVKVGFVYPFGGSVSNYTPSKPAAVEAAVVDSDNDGVIDDNDRCPGTPAGSKVDNNGCIMVVSTQKDTDGDGVFDSADQCPNTPANDVVDSDGCTRFGTEQVSQTVKVLFANNSANITEPSDPEIVEFANFMKRYGKTDGVIEGHASAPGEASYNLALSKKRAEAFKTLLVEEYGIAASRLSTVGYGEERLLDTSNTAAAHKKNRRIVVNISEKVKVKLTK
jgi:OOP family OmpA-OmpF porin